MSIRSRLIGGLALTSLMAGPAMAQPAAGLTADLVVEHVALSRTTLDDWSGAGLQLGYRNADNRLTWGRAEWSRRFGAQDLFLQAGLQDRLADGVASVALGSAFGGDFREDIDLRLAWTRPAWRPAQGAGGTDFDLTARFADYGDGVVTVLAPGLIHYLAGRDAWLSVSPIFVRASGGDWESGLALRGDTALGAKWRIRGGLSLAPDVEAGRVARTRSVEFGVRRAFGPHQEIGWTVSQVDRSGSYARTGLALSLRQRF
ncbi:YaiO family outer membrane beta-barrel protein [Maricaulis maris]|uniref:YaiO family outer membrane protein n=1 Tax=Maricaulis maris TaxID=74318 RepID=A0A495D3P7_9PROT|nr:YaiO family outer membrane beta-barrel protein [Maricaulis maris]RKQ96543.1 YaiO family outer membrane protein [Maricaulis maris]